MACCLKAPSHYLNHCWLIPSGVLWHSLGDNFTGNAQDNYPWHEFEDHKFWDWGRIFHQMEIFSAFLTICAGNSSVTGEVPTHRPVRWRFNVFSFICAWINGWVSNREAGDLRRHRAHYDINVMRWFLSYQWSSPKWYGRYLTAETKQIRDVCMIHVMRRS